MWVGLVFQFQSGAIKRLRTIEPSGIVDKFQFQSGAIKSASWFTVVLSDKSFNSNLVRLKGLPKCWRDLNFGAVSIPIWCD